MLSTTYMEEICMLFQFFDTTGLYFPHKCLYHHFIFIFLVGSFRRTLKINGFIFLTQCRTFRMCFPFLYGSVVFDIYFLGNVRRWTVLREMLGLGNLKYWSSAAVLEPFFSESRLIGNSSSYCHGDFCGIFWILFDWEALYFLFLRKEFCILPFRRLYMNRLLELCHNLIVSNWIFKEERRRTVLVKSLNLI